ncbi:MAG: DUF1643 domain-containing protein [Dethiobacter sp.]|nr:DUF1643 domain-containing protein [Dethiobacter sp.]
MHKIYVYKSFVDKNNIKIINADCRRYLLEIPLNSNKRYKNVLVILKNPSKATKVHSDLTINRVLTFCNNEGYSKVYIMNLFSYYSTKPEEIKALIDGEKFEIAIGNKNDKLLKMVLKDLNDVIVAWGGNTIHRKYYYRKRLKEVTKLIMGKNLYYVQSISEDKYYPRHAQTWSVNQGIKKYKWTPPEDLYI